MKKFLLSCFALLFSTSALSEDEPIKLNSPEWLFGQRVAIQHISLSPDGEQIVFIAPGPGRDSRVYHTTLTDKEPKMIAGSSGKPEQTLWCDFVSNARITCRIFYINDDGGVLLTNRELIALDIEGKDIKPLGQKRSFTVREEGNPTATSWTGFRIATMF